MNAQEYITNLALTAMNNDPDFLRRVVGTMLEMGIVDKGRIYRLLSTGASLADRIAACPDLTTGFFGAIAVNYAPNSEKSLPIDPSRSLVLKSSISNPSENNFGTAWEQPQWSPLSSAALLPKDCFSSPNTQEIAVGPSQMTPRKRHCDGQSNSEQLQPQQYKWFTRGRTLQRSASSTTCIASRGPSTEDIPDYERPHSSERTAVDKTVPRSTRAAPLEYARHTNRGARFRPYSSFNCPVRMEHSTAITENSTTGIFDRGASTRSRINTARNRSFGLDSTRYRCRGMTATDSYSSAYNVSVVGVIDEERVLSGFPYCTNVGSRLYIHRY